MDGDGAEDVTVPLGGLGYDEGVLATLPGATGEQLFEIPSDTREFPYVGAMAAIDDVDGDGLRDVLIAPERGRAIAFSGRERLRVPR